MDLAALEALLDNAPLTFLFFRTYWLHKAATVCSSIARIVVYVFRPKAVRAVVGIPVAVDFAVAIFTNKIFYVFDECHVQLKVESRKL